MLVLIDNFLNKHEVLWGNLLRKRKRFFFGYYSQIVNCDPSSKSEMI